MYNFGPLVWLAIIGIIAVVAFGIMGVMGIVWLFQHIVITIV